jgi:hypothetical protein
MKFKYIWANGRRSESESLVSILREMHAVCTPDLDNRLRLLRCPDHNTQLTGLTIQEIRLSAQVVEAFKDAGSDIDHALQFEFFAPCNYYGCCERFSDLANDVLDQDMEQGAEVPSLDDLCYWLRPGGN